MKHSMLFLPPLKKKLRNNSITLILVDTPLEASRVGDGVIRPSTTFNFSFKKKSRQKKIFFRGSVLSKGHFWDDFSWGQLVPSSKVVKKLSGPMTSYIVKENHNGSVVSKILRYTVTDRHPVTFIQGFTLFMFKSFDKGFFKG